MISQSEVASGSVFLTKASCVGGVGGEFVKLKAVPIMRRASTHPAGELHRTSVRLEIPETFVKLIFPNSSRIVLSTTYTAEPSTIIVSQTVSVCSNFLVWLLAHTV